MSWVFLAGDRVYKLKKPIRDRWLDFTTLTARERNAREEVRLNRRLAPDVYLGTAPLTVATDGHLAIDGRGEPIDWLVVMRRLPAERMLDRLITAKRVGRDDVEHLANRLADFYRDCPPVTPSVETHVALFREQQRLNRDVLQHARIAPELDRAVEALDAVDGFLADETELLAARVHGGHIVEGHGDLRAEHVCLEPAPVIIDCLEFNRSLRLVDPFDELANLALECRRLGAGWIGERLFDRCASALGERPPQRLQAFYTVARASLRARLAVRHLLEPEPRTPERWLPLARAYLAAADAARLSLKGPRADRPANR
jgi:aminoglycoside phosphotransferase family enzyme